MVVIMKRISVFLTVISLLLCMLTSSAASSVSFSTSDCETAKNRIFTVEVMAYSDEPLGAALFEFNYDSSAFEYRDASAEKPAFVEANSEDGRVRLSYLNSDGADCRGGAVIFTLSFKSKKAGSYTFGCTVSQCADCNADFMPVVDVKSGLITVTDSSTSAQSKSSKSSDSSKSSSSNSGKSKSSSGGRSSSGSSVSSEDTTENKIKDYGAFDDFSGSGSSKINLAAIVVLCAVSMAVSAAAVLAALKIRAVIMKKKASEEEKETNKS